MFKRLITAALAIVTAACSPQPESVIPSKTESALTAGGVAHRDGDRLAHGQARAPVPLPEPRLAPAADGAG